MKPNDLQPLLAKTAFAFRGYNHTNLGRSHELLRHPRYGEQVGQWLRRVSECAADLLRRPVDLNARVAEQRDPGLDEYADAIALVIAVELAQLDLLRGEHGVECRQGGLMFGYSLGEITALIEAGSMSLEDALRPPLQLAADAAELARGVRLGVFFSRGHSLDMNQVARLCIQTNQLGEGAVGVSAFLSPNSVLLMGQGDTLRKFKKLARAAFPHRTQMRLNQHPWPPLHTPLVWQRCIPNRAGVMMQSMQSGVTAPRPPILSMVTGKTSYTDWNIRDTLQRWTDSPQRLWDVVLEVLSREIQVLVHVGPQPNIIPATFRRLQDNVKAQVSGSLGVRTLSNIVNRPWLKAMLPTRTALLRAPKIRQVILEDWLLEAG